MTRTNRVVIVGGGVIGLSLAFEMAHRGHRVTILERDRLGRQASWAGAGILSPANYHTAIHPIDQLAGISNELHADWSRQLFELTGIDNGYRQCGGVYLASTPGDIATLAGSKSHWHDHQIPFQELNREQIVERIPELRSDGHSSAVWVPGEAQVCNPHHLRALAAAAKKLGVQIFEQIGDPVFLGDAQQIRGIAAGNQTFEFDQICFTAGAWTDALLEPLRIRLPMIPIRGQMLLFKLPEQRWQPIINEGSRYLVPRADGYVLAGSTTEEVGFDDRTTDRHIDELQEFAERLIPQLNMDRRVKTWAGLRPATFDGMPYMGRLPKSDDAFVATGHFKAGLQLSTGSAVVMSDTMEGKTASLDLTPFDPGRLDSQSAVSGSR